LTSVKYSLQKHRSITKNTPEHYKKNLKHYKNTGTKTSEHYK